MKHFAIIGNIRSGKTLLARALNTHPDISCQVEPFFPFFRMCQDLFYSESKRVRVAFEEREEFSKEFDSLYLSDTVTLKRNLILHQADNVTERTPWLLLFMMGVRPNYVFTMLDKLMYLLYRSYPVSNCSYIGFAEAWIERFMEPLMNNGFKVIQVIRDIRAIVASRNYSPATKGLYNKQYQTRDLVDHWKGSIQYFKVYYGHEPSYHAVLYEELIRKPRPILERICEFLEVDFHEDMLDTEKYVNGIGHSWRQNTNFKIGRGFSKDSLDKWKEVLPQNQLELINVLCASELIYARYEV